MSDTASSIKPLDDDSISLNSTIESEPQDEYPLDRILAERKANGTIEYLVKWQDYPDERCTWEAEENFRNDRTIPEWDLHKLRIQRGLEKPYDVDALEARVKAWLNATEERKSRRRVKRLRLGLPVPPTESEDNSNSLSEFEEETDDPDDPPPRVSYKSQEGKRRRTSGRVDLDTDEEDSLFVQPPALRKTKQGVTPSTQRSTGTKGSVNLGDQGKGDDASTGKEEESFSTEDSLMEDLHRKLSETSKKHSHRPLKDHEEVRSPLTGKLNTKTPFSQPAPINSFQNIKGSIKPKVSPAGEITHGGSRTTPLMMGKIGRGPARIRHRPASSLNNSRVSGSSVLKNWDKGPGPRRGLPSHAGTIQKWNRNSKPFEKLSTRRKLMKAGRNEPPPNLEDIVLRDPKHGFPARKALLGSLAIAPLSKSPFQMIHDNVARIEMLSPIEAPPKSATGLPPKYPTIGTTRNDDVDPPMHMDMLVSKSGEISASKVTRLPEVPNGERLEELRSTRPEHQALQNVPQNPSQLTFENTLPVPASSVQRSVLNSSRFHVHPMTLAQVKGDYGSKPAIVNPQQETRSNGKFVEDFSDVFGTIAISPEHTDLGEVKFRGLTKSVKGLLLKIKVPPKTVDLWFRQLCTAADYKLYFHDVWMISVELI